MSITDNKFKNLCREILMDGESSEGQIVRPKWGDGTPAHTIAIFGNYTTYDLNVEFPAITVRPTNIEAAIDEILWIYQKKSNNVKDLASHIWDSWADENGFIGRSYGFQMSQKHDCPQGYMDQVDDVLWQLQNTPYSRRIMTNFWNHEDASKKALLECAYSCTFGVQNGKLNMILNQRSQDVIVANNWNVVQYSALLMMLAQVSGFKPGVLTHMIANAHIYDRHVNITKELMERPSHIAPKIILDPEIKNFYDFKVDSFKIENYKTEPQIKNIPVAV